MILGICMAFSSSIANSVKFSAIVLVAEAELVPRSSCRMRVEEQILPALGNSFLTFYLCHQQLDHDKRIDKEKTT